MNMEIHPVNTFEDDDRPLGTEIKVNQDDLEYFLKGQFFHMILKHPNGCAGKIATTCLSTYNLFISIFPNSIIYVGPSYYAEIEAIKQAEKYTGKKPIEF